MSLQTQYRPKSFKTFFGNDHVIDGLKMILERKQPPSAFMFTGPGGTGKTTLARILKKGLNCSDSDWKELNASDDRGIDAIRSLIESMRFAPMDGEKKVYFLDEAHMLTKPSQEALLKSLEEPPEYVHWIICTTNPETLKPTLKRRCHIYELSPLKENELNKLMGIILKREKRDEYVTQKVRDQIIEVADGSAGQALKLLDMVIDMKDEERALSTIKYSGAELDEDSRKICKVLLNGNMNARTKWAKVKELLKNLKGEPEGHRYKMLGYFSSVMLNNGGDDEFFIIQPFRKSFMYDGKAGLISACYEAIFGDGE